MKNRLLEQKFLEMYDGFSDELFRFCLSKTRNRDLSLDIVQEAFIKTWDYMRKGEEVRMARAFLYRIARNLIIDHSRKKQTVSLDAIVEGDAWYDLPDKRYIPTSERLDRKDQMERLKELPEHHYEILVMRFIQELTLAELAAIYKESENTISVRIHRAIKHAQKMFPDMAHDYEI